MAGETVITVVGNLVDDPELRFTPSGAAVANFRIASTPRTFNRQTNEWEDGEALFLSCSVWRQAAENVAESLQKGMRVVVQGRLKQRSYEDREGQRRTVIEMEVDEVGPSLRYATAKVERTQRGGPREHPDPADPGDPVGRRRDRLRRGQSELVGEDAARPLRHHVGRRVGRVEGDVVLDELREQRALVAILGDGGHTTQQQRVVRDEEVGVGADGFVDGRGDRVDREEDAVDRGVRISGDQPGGVPSLRTGDRPERFGDFADGTESVRHGLEPTGSPRGRGGQRRRSAPTRLPAAGKGGEGRPGSAELLRSRRSTAPGYACARSCRRTAGTPDTIGVRSPTASAITTPMLLEPIPTVGSAPSRRKR